MRKIDLVEPQGKKAWVLWRKDCDKATAELHAAVARNEAPVVTELYKRDSIRKLYFFFDGPPFYRKCAFCERPTPDLRDGDVEHFRPKGAVTDEKDNPVFLRDEHDQILADAAGKPVPHPGYYWLAYDWRNLLIACRRCNQPTAGSLGKKTRFPVSGRHAHGAAEVGAEQPLLIHPASGSPEDDPEKHLDVDAHQGVIFSTSPRGQMCIDVFGLNEHSDLIDGRKSAANEVRYLLIQMISGQRATASVQLDLIVSGKRPFTLAARAALRQAKADLGQLAQV